MSQPSTDPSCLGARTVFETAKGWLTASIIYCDRLNTTYCWWPKYRDSLEQSIKKNVNTQLLLLMAFGICVFELYSAAVKFRRVFKKIKVEIFLKSHVFRCRGLQSKAPDIILRFGSAFCIILSDGLQHPLITVG